MDDDPIRPRPQEHVVGMLLDGLSVEELQARIDLLEGEITRLKTAIGSREKSRSAAEAAFKF